MKYVVYLIAITLISGTIYSTTKASSVVLCPETYVCIKSSGLSSDILNTALKFNKLENNINSIDNQIQELTLQQVPDLKGISQTVFKKSKQETLTRLIASSTELRSEWITLYNSVQ